MGRRSGSLEHCRKCGIAQSFLAFALYVLRVNGFFCWLF